MEYLQTILHTNPLGNAGKINSFFIFVQEPLLCNEKAIGFGKAHNFYYDQFCRPTCFVCIQGLKYVACSRTSSTTGDMTTCMWGMEEEGAKDIFITSVYMDITNTTVWPPCWRNCYTTVQGRGRRWSFAWTPLLTVACGSAMAQIGKVRCWKN